MLELLLCKVGKALFGLFATQERIMSKLHIAIIGIISCTINVIYQRRFLPQRIHRLLHLVQMSAYHSVLSHQICLYLMILSHLFFHLFHQILLYPLIFSHHAVISPVSSDLVVSTDPQSSDISSVSSDFVATTDPQPPVTSPVSSDFIVSTDPHAVISYFTCFIRIYCNH
jgi:hypothetical protein